MKKKDAPIHALVTFRTDRDRRKAQKQYKVDQAMDPEDVILENVGSKSITCRLLLTVIVYCSLLASILLGQYYIFEYRTLVIIPTMLAFPKITNFMTGFIAFDSLQSQETYEFTSKFLQRLSLLAVPDLLKSD